MYFLHAPSYTAQNVHVSMLNPVSPTDTEGLSDGARHFFLDVFGWAFLLSKSSVPCTATLPPSLSFLNCPAGMNTRLAAFRVCLWLLVSFVEALLYPFRNLWFCMPLSQPPVAFVVFGVFVYWLFWLVSAVEREVRFWLMQLALLVPYEHSCSVLFSLGSLYLHDGGLNI